MKVGDEHDTEDEYASSNEKCPNELEISFHLHKIIAMLKVVRFHYSVCC